MGVRNPISDLEAAAAMPGLDELAAVMAGADTAARRVQSDPAALVLLLIGRWAFGSMRMAESAMLHGGVWDRMRASALRVGRLLPADAPTADQLDAWRRRVCRAGEGLGQVAELLAATFTEVAVPLVQSAGLLVADEPRWQQLSRTNVLYADGSGFQPLSGLVADPDGGSVEGSRSKYAAGTGPGNRGPRVAETFVDKDQKPSLPVSSVGVHGGKPLQRGVVAVRLFRDGREVAWSLDAIRAVVEQAGGGVHGVVYDRAMDSHTMWDLMNELGVMPIVEMKAAQKSWSGLDLPQELQRRRYAKGGKRQKRPGKGRIKEKGKENTKTRVRLNEIDFVSHLLPVGRCGDMQCTDSACGHPVCYHVVWAMDGTLVTAPLGTKPTLDVVVMPQRRLERVEGPAGGYRFLGHYDVPCPGHGLVPYVFDHTGLRPGHWERNKRRNVIGEWVRAIPETDPWLERIRGWREDAESTFSTLKRRMRLDGQAASLDPDNFLIDMVAAGMFVNAVLWDEHVAGHTAVAR